MRRSTSATVRLAPSSGIAISCRVPGHRVRVIVLEFELYQERSHDRCGGKRRRPVPPWGMVVRRSSAGPRTQERSTPRGRGLSS